MKNIYVFLSISLLFLSLQNNYSQLTLTSEFNPVIGDLQKSIDCDTTGILQGGSGLNQNWNFVNLIKIDSGNFYFVDPAKTPFIDSFPTANITGVDSSQSPIVYDYYKTSSINNLYQGQEYIDVDEKLTTPEISFQYPFTYNSSYLDTFSGYGVYSGYVFNAIGTISKIGDASGTLILPIGTYQNALRVRTHSYEYDSVTSINYIITTSYTEYDWYVASYKFPIFTIYYDTIVDNGDTIFDKSVYYCNSQPIGIKKIGKEVPSNYTLSQNYPNPFNPSTRISFEIPKATFVSLIIYDMLGREIEKLVNEELKPGVYSFDWDANNYPSGTYLYQLRANDFVQTKRMVLVK